jgi:hypothetical protein
MDNFSQNYSPNNAGVHIQAYLKPKSLITSNETTMQQKIFVYD